MLRRDRVAMLAVMRYRRSKYSTRMQRAGPQWKRSLPVLKLAREKSPKGDTHRRAFCCRTTDRKSARLPLGLGRAWTGKPEPRECR